MKLIANCLSDSTSHAVSDILNTIRTVIDDCSYRCNDLATKLSSNDVILDFYYSKKNLGKIEDSLLRLIAMIVSKCTSIKYASSLLVFYNGTLNARDQAILSALINLERSSEISLLSLRPLVWGKSAKNFYTKSKMRNVKEQKIQHLIANFDRNKLDESIANFATDVSLDSEFYEERDLLDPRFVLPVLVHSTDAELKINCEKFVTCKGLSYAISSLSSESEDIRKIGYMIINRFYQQLEFSPLFKDRDLWLTFLELIRISSSNFKQLRPVVALTLVDMIEITLSPDDFMYHIVRNFIASEASDFSTKRIVDFLFALLNSAEKDKYHLLEKWSLNKLTNGLKTESDFDAYIECNVFSGLMNYYLSPFLNNVVRIFILNIFSLAVKHPNSLNKLNSSCAFLAWLMQLACGSIQDKDNVKKALQNLISQSTANYLSETKIKRDNPPSEAVFFDDLSCILCLAAST